MPEAPTPSGHPAARRRKPRRVTRAVTSLGPTTEGMTRLPAPTAPAASPQTPATPTTAEHPRSDDAPPRPQAGHPASNEPVLPSRAGADADARDDDNNEDRLMRDKPPHWG